MKLVLVLIFTISAVWAISEKCAVLTQEDCENMTSEYEKYRSCMERRSKRSIDCDYEEDECGSCDCNSCKSSCSNCNTQCCTQCCQKTTCNTYSCCHQTCRAECKSNACRSSCKKRCQDPANPRETIVSQTQTGSNHNITTVIHLNNVINNTNLINLPININSSLINNITNEGTGQYSPPGTIPISETDKERCCLTIGPRQCIPQSAFPFVRCFHIRKRSCGSICTAPVVHYQTHEICDNEVNVRQPCKQHLVYIPQPQPRCAYQPSWPYVTCGNTEMQSCEGCYSHYIKRDDVTKCSSFCYDDGYGAGPYYRQGPFYRPGFAHAPSCFQTGSCGGFYGGYGFGYDYGAYGAFPESSFPAAYPPQTYPNPFVIEDCNNCAEDLNYKNLQAPVQWQAPNSLVNIDASVGDSRPGRYAEIRIRPDTSTESAITTETIISTTDTV